MVSDPPRAPSRGPRASRSESRLDELREEAARRGAVEGGGVRAVGSPLPQDVATVGYYGHPVVKPPVWTWEVPLYFFVGGLAGMAAVIGLAAYAARQSPLLMLDALRLAALGAVISPLLLILDLGRPSRFLNMLRVFKHRSPMSVGVWTLVLFDGAALAGWALLEWFDRVTFWLGPDASRFALKLALLFAAVLGAVLATYTGVLLGATAIPAWASHRALLPFHFGLAGLGSAAAVLELMGHRLPALWLIGTAVAGTETCIGFWVELRRGGIADRVLHRGLAAWTLRVAGFLAGPAALVLRLEGPTTAAAICFLLGALISRYGWVAAGRASARDAEAALAG